MKEPGSDWQNREALFDQIVIHYRLRTTNFCCINLVLVSLFPLFKIFRKNETFCLSFYSSVIGLVMTRAPSFHIFNINIFGAACTLCLLMWWGSALSNSTWNYFVCVPSRTPCRLVVDCSVARYIWGANMFKSFKSFNKCLNS